MNSLLIYFIITALNSGIIVYSGHGVPQISDVKAPKLAEQLILDHLKKEIEIPHHYQKTVYFNADGAFFYTEPDAKNKSPAEPSSQCYNYKQDSLLDFNKLELTTEQKKIMGFPCQKAVEKNEKGEVIKEVWFTTWIKNDISPLGLYQSDVISGMILEMKGTDSYYKITRYQPCYINGDLFNFEQTKDLDKEAIEEYTSCGNLPAGNPFE